MFYTLQAGRAVAAMMVVLFHVGNTLSKDKYFGDTALWLHQLFVFGGDAGVAFFFVLSGFVIHTAHQKDIASPAAAPEYLRKRLTRIFPTYWIIFLGAYLLAYAVPSLRANLPAGEELLKAVFLIPQEKTATNPTGAAVLSAAWTLQYELLFYALFAAAILSKRLVVAVIAIYFGAWATPGPDGGVYPAFLFSHFIGLFLLGIVAAAAVAHGERLPPPRHLLWVGATLFALTCLAHAITLGVGRPLRDLGYGLGSLLLLAGLVGVERRNPQAYRSQIVKVAGDASYAVYLVHYPVVSAGCKVLTALLPLREDTALLSFVLLTIVSVAAGVAFHWIIERPLLKKMARPRQPVARLPTASDAR